MRSRLVFSCLQSTVFLLCPILASSENLPKIAIKTHNIIKVNKPQSSCDATYSYYIGLIKLSLRKVNKSNTYKIVYTNKALSQKRSLSELQKKDSLINIFQTGTSAEREKKLVPIRIPLLKGTLGYRISIIRKDNKDRFDKIKTLEDLSKLTACQGTHWPDSDILENAGLKVLRNTKYKNMFLQLKSKRCDYFPRAIIEAYSEVNSYKDPDLMVYDKLILSYKFPMYFFVSPHQKQLAEDIEKGLRIAIKDGSFNRYFETNENTRRLFPLSKWKNHRVFHLDNKSLQRNTSTTNKKLWLTLPSN